MRCPALCHSSFRLGGDAWAGPKGGDMHGELADEIREYARKIATAPSAGARPKRYVASDGMPGLADLKQRVAALSEADRSALAGQFAAEQQVLGLGQGIPLSLENLCNSLEPYLSKAPSPQGATSVLVLLLLIWLLDLAIFLGPKFKLNLKKDTKKDLAEDILLGFEQNLILDLIYADEHKPFDLVDPDPAFWYQRIDTDGTLQFSGPDGYVVQTIPTIANPTLLAPTIPYCNAEIHNSAWSAMWPKNINLAYYPVDPPSNFANPTPLQFWNIINDFFLNFPFMPSKGFAFSGCIRAENLKCGSRGWGFWNLCSTPPLMQIAWFMQVDGALPDGQPPLVPVGFYAIVQNGLDVKFIQLPDLDENWHDYAITVTADRVEFFVDTASVAVFDAAKGDPVPVAPMAFEMWVDNAVYGGKTLFWPQTTAAPRSNVVSSLRVRSLPRPTTAAGALAFYDSRGILPHAQSQSQLASFLSRNHPDYDLTAWCFFGYLTPEGGSEADKIALASLVQYLRPPKAVGSQSAIPFAGAPIYVAGLPYCSKTSGGYELLGTIGLLPSQKIQVASDPWSVVVTYGTLERQLSTICYSLVGGKMGEKHARYRVTGKVLSESGKWVTIDIHLEDRFGVVSEGYGPAAFSLGWLNAAQNQVLMKKYEGSVASYLENAGEQFAGQGSYYLSFPLLNVTQFQIHKEGERALSGTSGCLWFDFVVEGCDNAGWRRASLAKWYFFAIQFPDESEAYMIEQTESFGYPSTVRAAKHFCNDSPYLPNSARDTAQTWTFDEIEIVPEDASKWWRAPSGNSYPLSFTIRLNGDAGPCQFTLTAIFQDQEIRPPNATGGAKYEGIFAVTRYWRSKETHGTAYVEIH